MNRLLVALLAAFDALIAAVVGVAAVLAPLTVFWVIGFGGAADWGALWPASVRVWQLGQFVPLVITLPDEYRAVAGIPVEAASFVLSLAPLAFATFTAIFAARSGARAARGGAWIVGVLSGTVVTGLIAAGLWATSGNPIAAVYGWQSLLFPTLVFALPALGGALVSAWRSSDDGIIDGLRARLELHPRWAEAPAAAARGLGVAVAALVGIGALLVAVAALTRGSEVVALFESAHVDALGASVIAIGQLAYLPTVIVWGAAFAAGPGFALGVGTTVSPAGTNLGVLPGIPMLGLIPESVSSWMLLLALLVVGAGFAAGWAARARLTAGAAVGLSGSAPRLAVWGAVVVLGASAAALLAVAASGSIGPERLTHLGPAAGPFAFTVGIELAIGAAIALFTPVRAARLAHSSFDDDDLSAYPPAQVALSNEPREPFADESTLAVAEPFDAHEATSTVTNPDAQQTQPIDSPWNAPRPPVD